MWAIIQRVTADCTAGFPDLLLELTRQGVLTRMCTCAELKCGDLPDKVRGWISPMQHWDPYAQQLNR